MQALLHVIPLVIGVSLGLLELSIGMQSTWTDATSLLRRPAGLLKAVVAVNLAPPVAAAALIGLFSLSAPSETAILLMAVSPAPPFAPLKSMKLGASRAYACGLYVALVVLAVAVVPAMVALLARLYGADVSVRPADVASKIALKALLPMAVGMLIRWKFPALAERCAPIASKLAVLLLLLALAPIVIALWPKISALAGDGTIAAAMLMVAAGLAAGHLLGGPDPADRKTLGVTAATRHPGFAMMIASANSADKTVSIAIVLVLLAGLVTVAIYQAVVKRRGPQTP
jgi:BASS family bile acid:Na+ symporter